MDTSSSFIDIEESAQQPTGLPETSTEYSKLDPASQENDNSFHDYSKIASPNIDSTSYLQVPPVAVSNGSKYETSAAPKEISRSLSVVSRTSVQPEPKPKEYKLKIFIGILFCVIVASVITIYHFYNKQQYHLELGKSIDFDEISRIVRVKNEKGDEVLKGEIGLTLPPGMIPYNCEPDDLYEEASCVGWKHKARVYIDYNESSHINCYHVNWISEGENIYPYDCYEFGDAKWYGGILPMAGDFENLHFESQPFVTSTPNSPNGFGPVIEPFWLTSKAVALYIEGDPPLHISVNKMNDKNETDGKLCLIARYVESPYNHVEGRKPWLNYTVCTAPNILDMHKFMLERMANNNPRPPNPPPAQKFTQVIYSTWARFKQNFDQGDVLAYVNKAVEDQMAKGIILLQDGWQSKHGDLTFDTNRFPNSSQMVSEIHNKGYEVGVAVSHMVAVDSQAFQRRMNDGSLVKDAGGVTEGLIDYYVGPHTPGWHQAHTAAIDFTSSAFDSRYINTSLQVTNVDDVHFDGGQVDLLPYRAHFENEYDSPNMYTSQYVSVVPEEAWSIVQAAYRSQHLDNFIQLYDANTTLYRDQNGYESVLPQAIALGIMGYPFFVPSTIDGSNYPGSPQGGSAKYRYQRWAQLVAFFPVMHFGSLPSKHDQDVVSMVNELTDIHKFDVKLAIDEALDEAHNFLYPIVRPLWWYDPNDEECIRITDQFMVGRKLLVAPMQNPDETNRNVYLPRGSWKDELTGDIIEGPKWLEAYDANFDAIPWFTAQ